ncbi:hypothetical protein [Moraxella lacunata]|uniref:hypothetical protein n=1 Tax=Moraxella lacunata TaxID=477 RepID=UPI003EE00C71
MIACVSDLLWCFIGLRFWFWSARSIKRSFDGNTIANINFISLNLITLLNEFFTNAIDTNFNFCTRMADNNWNPAFLVGGVSIGYFADLFVIFSFGIIGFNYY